MGWVRVVGSVRVVRSEGCLMGGVTSRKREGWVATRLMIRCGWSWPGAGVNGAGREVGWDWNTDPDRSIGPGVGIYIGMRVWRFAR